MKSTLFPILLISLSALTHAGETDSKVVAPPAPVLEDTWQFRLSAPAWIPWMTGETGLRGTTANVDLGPDDLIPRLDMTVDLRAEARKGRFSVLGEFLYMSLSDGIGTETIVKKLDVRLDQTIGDLAVAWRVIETPRGYLDVIGGVRYTNLYQRLTLQPNDEKIDAAVDRFASAVGSRLREEVREALVALAGQNPTIPIAPLDADQVAALTSAIETINGRAQDTLAKRKARIADAVQNALDRRVDRRDEWFDPYIGVRGLYNLTDKFYLSGKGDIGGFGVGSDLSWTAEVAFGTRLSANITSEIAYRALGVDYDQDGLVVDTITHGPQVTLGVHF